MYNPSHELALLIAMADDFKSFVQSDVVFWQLTDAGPFRARHPKLTVAGLLFCCHKLAVFHTSLSPNEQQGYVRITAELDNQLSTWRANLERKALREVQGRLHSWAWYLDECAENPNSCVSSYSTEVHARNYLKFLLDALAERSEAPAERIRLCQLDVYLRTVLESGSFVWDLELQPAFPQEDFWFLYGYPSV